MNRTIALTSLAAVLMAGPALAQDRRAEPSAPQPIADILDGTAADILDGAAATVTGTVSLLVENGFVVRDETGEVFVQTVGFQAVDLHPGDPVTVPGRLERYDLIPDFIVRSDGSVAQPAG